MSSLNNVRPIQYILSVMMKPNFLNVDIVSEPNTKSYSLASSTAKNNSRGEIVTFSCRSYSAFSFEQLYLNMVGVSGVDI